MRSKSQPLSLDCGSCRVVSCKREGWVEGKKKMKINVRGSGIPGYMGDVGSYGVLRL